MNERFMVVKATSLEPEMVVEIHLKTHDQRLAIETAQRIRGRAVDLEQKMQWTSFANVWTRLGDQTMNAIKKTQ